MGLQGIADFFIKNVKMNVADSQFDSLSSQLVH